MANSEIKKSMLLHITTKKK